MTIAVNWIKLREAFEVCILEELDQGVVVQVNYDKGPVTRAASQMAVQVRSNSGHLQLEETFDQLVMSLKMRGQAVNEPSLYSAMRSLYFGALAALAAMRSS